MRNLPALYQKWKLCRKILYPIAFLTFTAFNSVAQQGGQDYWYQKPMRILQTVMRQPDAASYNVDSLVNYMKKVHANTLVVNGGGVMDFFQNRLPMANINPYIGKRDLLAEIVEGCHKEGIKVITRVDFRGVEKERYEQHPDWFARDEYGNPIILNYTTPEVYAPCYNSYYRNEHAVEFIEQLMSVYHVDGIWHNAVNFHNKCYCDRCTKEYLEKTGKPIPVKDSSKGDWDEYYKWNEGVAEKQLALMRSTIKKYGNDKSYAAEVFDMYKIEQQKETGISFYSVAEYFDFLVIVAFMADNTAEIEYKDIYYPSAIVKFLKSLKPDKAPVILFGGNGTDHRYIYASPIDTRLWMWESAASGGGFWNCYFNGYYPANAPDARNAYVTTDAYKYLDDNSEFIQHIQPVTDIGILYSKPSGELLGDESFAGSLRGLQRLMAENHYQYGFISEKDLSPEKLKQFKVLILPDAAAMSDKHVRLIEEWVIQGGRLLSSFQTSLFDENGVARKDFGLNKTFGISYLNQVVNTQMDCYQKIITRNELVKGMELTTLLHNGGRTLMTKALNGTEIITGYLPKINNQPPENAFPASWESGNPIMVRKKSGKGESIYFANEIEKLNYTIGHPDYDRLLTNSINYLLGSHRILVTNAPSSVHIYLNKSETATDTYQLSLVNTSGSSQRPYRDLIPVNKITIELPFMIRSAHALCNSSGKEARINDNTITIDTLEEFYSLKLVAK
ncbi:MAG TPA: alpha-amylase family protein [Bacteroidales bacterium]|nr:alpha-amylase family protein [Bacteroidales bacterium]